MTNSSMKKVKYLVTSGCSFSIGENECWPKWLSNLLNSNVLYVCGQSSAGNDWIAMSTIYKVQKLLADGVKPNEILVAVMWSGIDRTSIFISDSETTEFKNLINDTRRQKNPVSLETGLSETVNSSGWLLGSGICQFDNRHINRFKNKYLSTFVNNEWLMIKSINCWLQLQWFCKSYGIRLINQTYMNIWNFPLYKYKDKSQHRFCSSRRMIISSDPLPKFYETYKENVSYLYELLDLDDWIFFRDYDGLYEYTFVNNLEYEEDQFHPSAAAHKHYVENFLWPEIKF